MKAARIKPTSFEIQVPAFVEIGDTIKQGETTVQYDLYLDTRNGYAGFPGAVQRANALKFANSSNNYTVAMTAGTFNLDSKLTASGCPGTSTDRALAEVC